jgi:hypothetical protein
VAFGNLSLFVVARAASTPARYEPSFCLNVIDATFGAATTSS